MSKNYTKGSVAIASRCPTIHLNELNTSLNALPVRELENPLVEENSDEPCSFCNAPSNGRLVLGSFLATFRPARFDAISFGQHWRGSVGGFPG